MECDQSGFEW